MDRATNEIYLPQERPRTGRLQGKTERTGPSSQGSSFNSYGTGDQFNAPEGKLNITQGPGNQFPGANFNGPMYFGTKEHFDPLRECLRSLAFPEMDSRFNDIDAAAKGTCEWLLRHETYTSWASCDRGLLWIKGKPGSGKSTLLWNVLNDVAPRLKTGEGALILKFFFHDRGTELQRTPLGLFRSLLYQLSQVSDALSDLVASFQQRCETIGKPGEKWQWHPRELQRFFESSLPKVLRARPVWLFVDALDECGKENAVKLVEDFESMLQRPPSSDLKRFRICFTCRHYPILNLDSVFEVCVENENWKDISTFVQDKLSSFRVRTSSTIPDLITNRADGVFLWAWLIVKQVLDLEREGIGLKKIEAKIYSVPQKLDDLYRELIRNMGSDSLKLIQWICFATRPLSLDELRWAMVVDTDCPHRSLYECQAAGDYPSDHDGMKRRVQTLSCGLAEAILSSGDVDEDLSEPGSSSRSIDSSIRTEATPSSHAQVVQFIHQSVKDFFVEKGLSALDETTKPDFVVGIAHHRLSRTCIRYLAMEEIGRSASHEPYRLRSNFPFLHYATTSWVAHTKHSDARSVPQEDLLEYFAGPSSTLVERWVRIYRILEEYSGDRPPEGTSLVHVMSRYGVAGALGAILERADQVGINIDAKDWHGRTPLSWAAYKGHDKIVKLLLQKGIDPDPKDIHSETPLGGAACQGHEGVVKQLLANRLVNPDAKYRTGETPLWWAAYNGHEGVVRHLLAFDNVEPDSKNIDHCTPLWAAACSGNEKIFQLLLEKGVDPDPRDQHDRSALSVAAERGHETIVSSLLANIAVDPDFSDEDGKTPLSYATAFGHYTIVEALLADSRVDPESRNRWGRTPFWSAAGNGHVEVINLLLKKGVNPDTKDDDGRTPLWWAAVHGQDAVVKLFLQQGVDPGMIDRLGFTPLSFAAGKGHKAIVELLLAHNQVNPDCQDKWGGTPLFWAVVNGHESVAELLCGKEVQADGAGELDLAPLLEAAIEGDDEFVECLLSKATVDLLMEVTSQRDPSTLNLLLLKHPLWQYSASLRLGSCNMSNNPL